MELGTETRECGATNSKEHAVVYFDILLRGKFLSQICALLSHFLSQIRQLEKRQISSMPKIIPGSASAPSPPFFGRARSEREIFSQPVPPTPLSVTGSRTLSRPLVSHLPWSGAARNLITSCSTHAFTHAPPLCTLGLCFSQLWS